jgi:hypothetical protein
VHASVQHTTKRTPIHVSLVSITIELQKLNGSMSPPLISIFKDLNVVLLLSYFHEKYVVVPADNPTNTCVNYKNGCIKSKTMGSRNCLPFQSIWFNSRFSWVFLVVFCLQLFVFSPFSFWFLYCLSVENELRLFFGIFKLFLRKRIFKRWPQLISYFCIWNCWKNEINIFKLLSL